MNLPNSLTLARIFLVPLLVVVLLTEIEGPLLLGLPRELVGAAIFAIASLTDWLDGYLARSRKQITAFGQMIDPLADKVLITAALISLVQMGLAPAWMVAIIVGRELAVTGLRGIAYSRGNPMPASRLGKFKMVVEVMAVLLLLVGSVGVPILLTAGYLVLWLAVVAALMSGVDYYRRFKHVLNPKVEDFAAARERASRKKASSR
jgi:CDP-diacylglycerol---glycerol-3-phosphate 3-phosphatidyltransferase